MKMKTYGRHCLIIQIKKQTTKVNELLDRFSLCPDVKLIMPTLLILLFTIFIMVTVIPYAFSNVIKQLQAVRLLEQQQEGR